MYTYSKSSTSASNNLSIYSIFCLFALLTIFYLPVDDLTQASTGKEQHSLSGAADSVNAPDSMQETLLAVEANTVNPRQDHQTVKQDSLISAPSFEQEINSYVNSIVADRYPELDPIVIQAIIYNESRYTPDAINDRSGTMGLMQISPKWHTQRAANLGVTDLLNPYGNILVGCDILAEVTRQTGSFTYALDVFAGGYAYANLYVNSVSPTREKIFETVSLINNGVIYF